MGIALEDVSILERSRLPFVAVDHQIPGLRAGLWDEGPLFRGRKSSPAQTAEVCPRDLVDDLLRRHGDKRLLGCEVAAAGNIRVEPGALCVLEPRGEHRSVSGDKRLHSTAHNTRGGGPGLRLRGLA